MNSPWFVIQHRGDIYMTLEGEIKVLTPFASIEKSLVLCHT
uniref:Uncharacterized protein n=1 Tax=Manihot esculenta TaxID=3983 RepID=A0A2C9UZP0_MANES